MQRSLLPMRFSKTALKALPFPLRWVLALVLILNGAVAQPVMAHAATADDHGAVAHAMPGHCHDASPSSAITKHVHSKCPCCANGNACQCGCVVALALPMTFPDLRPFAPLALADRLRVPQFAAAPQHRLLRPPIV